MNILVNNKAAEIPDGSTLSRLAEILGLPERGVAVAVNRAMVPQSDWGGRMLSEGDAVIVIKAACGG